MKIWVYLNGIQQGPYTLEEVQQLNLTPSTPVWYEGLPQWQPASEAPLTASLFAAYHTVEQPVAESDQRQEPAFVRPAATSASAVSDMPPAPPTFIGWSIFALLCCFPIGGLLGIIFSVISGNAYRSGDYAKAARMSEYAEWCIILSIVLGLIMAPLAIAIF